jgi:hypothetical protein
VVLAACLLVLLGFGLFVAGILSGMTALYWACVAVCGVAAVLLVQTRRQLGAATRAEAVAAPATPVAPVPAGGGPAGEPDTASLPPRAVDEPELQADPPVEEVEVTDLLMVVDLTDEVLVLDERPRYHLAGCVHLSGRTAIPLPLDEARTDGFTPCAVCAPDRNLARRARERRAAGS